jgi:hypothetical protein
MAPVLNRDFTVQCGCHFAASNRSEEPQLKRPRPKDLA